MDEGVMDRMDRVDLLAKNDPEYRQMLKEVAILERAYDDVLSSLEYEQQDIIYDFVFYCESMSRKVLEIACTHMRFPE